MDIIDSCKAILKERLEQLEANPEGENSDLGPQTQTEGHSESQSFPESYFSDPDKNLSKILNQQSHLKRTIDQDNSIQLAKCAIQRVCLEIESYRASCTKQNADALLTRHQLAEDQAKELERFQMGQIKSIADDFSRHQAILENRRKEIQDINKVIENEQNGRAAYLADREKKLDKQLQDRQNSIRGGTLPFQLSASRSGTSNLIDDLNNPNHVELTSVDEYAPYGTAPHSRMNDEARSAAPRARGRGRGRGRKKG